MNQITVVGNLTADPEIRYTSGGKAVAHFTVASDRSRAKDAKTDFLQCEAWEALAESVNTDIRKGHFIRVTGTLRLESYEAKDGTKRTAAKVIVRKVEAVTEAAAHAEDQAL